MRLPNGYGSVYKLSGNRRNPWVAAKTDGYDIIKKEQEKKLKRKYHIIGYYPTKSKALQALADFNDNPYDIELSKVTFAEIYQRWYKEEFNDESNTSTKRNYEMAYKKCAELHHMRMADVRPNHMQKALDEAEGGYQTIKRIQILFKQLYKWCINHDCIKKNYAEQTKINVKYDPTPRERFSTDEVKKVWEASKDNENAAIVLILLYSGVRIMDLLSLKKKDVNLEEQYFYVRKSKTTSGTRTVPIADKVLPFWKAFMNKSECDYAICNVKGQQLTYSNFQKRYWQPLMQELGINHTPHETRHTFISMAMAKNINPTLIKKIVGHKSIMSLTEKVYTHPEIKEMIEAVNLLVTC
jgi:site-specific recombinase XerD